MRNIAIQQKGQVQEVQVTVKDAAQEAQEARVNCEEANVSQKLLLKDVEKKVKMKVKMRRRSFAHFYPTKSPTNPINPTYSTNPTTPNGPTNPTNPTYSTNPTMPNGPTNPTNPTYSTNSTKPNGPTNPTNPTYSTNPTKPNGPTNPTTVCPSPSITTISTISTSTKPAKPNNRFW